VKKKNERRRNDLKHLKIKNILTNIFLEEILYFTLNAATNIVKLSVKKSPTETNYEVWRREV
jgi:hypothetical protein